ncbi:MAG: substrate-binding domain-containing protein [Fusobacteriaceae bacterium]
MFKIKNKNPYRQLLIGLIFSFTAYSQDILMGTTTSLDDTGFLNEMAQKLKAEKNINVQWVAKGTGEALELGKRGDVDLLFIHDPVREEKFIQDGYGKKRHPIMYNHFVLVTSKDFNLENFPKNIREILSKIQRENIPFFSRGDSSGTHSKELGLWKEIGVEPKFKNYREIGQGMAKTLHITSEMDGITLSDNGTFYSLEKSFHLKEIPMREDDSLKNIYSLVELSQEEESKKESIKIIIEFLESPQGKKMIQDYGKEKFGKPLFNNM